MRVARVGIVVLLFIVLGSGCRRDPGETGPTASELEAKLTAELPGYVRVTSFKVDASENVGDKVDPVFKGRFLATLKLQSDTFLESSREAGAVFVVPHLKAGTTRDLYGKSLASLKAGVWQIGFSFDNNPIPDMGVPKDFISGGEVFERGSREEDKFRERQRKEQEQALHEAAEAEKLQAERVQTVVSSALTRALVGSSSSGQTVWPMRLRVASFDRSTGHVVGEVDWPTLNGTNQFTGEVMGARLVFTETEIIRKGAGLKCRYTLTAISPRALDGSFTCPKGEEGLTHLELE